MASTKSFEDMLLSSDIDESVVSALVGSLDAQLSSSDAHYPRNELSSNTINNNHIPSASVADCVARLPDGQQKHGALLGSLLEQGSQNTNKNLVNSQIMGLNSQNLSNAVIVSLPGALPASGYLNQVSSTQQALVNPSVVSKLVYSPHSTAVSHFSSAVTSTVVSPGVITTNSINRNNFKIASLHNGSSNFSAGQQQIATSGGPVLTGPQTTISAMQNLANIASQQSRIQVANPSGHNNNLAQQQLNALNIKNAPRNPVDPKSKQISATNNSDHRHSPSNHYQVLSGQAASVITSKPNQVSHLSNPPVNVVTQVVSNSNMLPPSVQIVNMNSPRFGQKTLAPRGLVVSNQLRIAPQMIRPGTPIPGQGAIALPPGMRSAIVVRADGSQYQLFSVPTPNSTNTTYRVQTLPGSGIIRSLSHPQVVTVPVSSSTVKTLQSGPGGIVRTLSPQQMTVTSQALAKNQQSHTVVSTVLQQTSPSVTRSTSSATTASSGAMSPNTIKKKCQNFLSTLIRLAGDEATKTASNVKKLIQNLIDGAIEPEEFSTQLQKELQSNHQPYLIHFLKKSLPHVRQALITGEMTIEGIRPPLPASMQSVVPTTQMGTLRPILAPTPRGIVTSIGGSALTAQLSQPPGNTILTQRLISPQVPQGINRPVRPMSIASSYGMIESSPATVGALQSKIVIPKQVSIIKSTSASKEKKPFVSVRDEDDINDVAAMGGVNLMEESQRILATNSELIGTQIRSCKDDNHFLTSALHRRILQIAKKHGLEEVRSDVVDLVSHAAEHRLKTLIEKLSVVAEHRCENPKVGRLNNKCDPRYEVTSDTKAQIKFLEELDKLEKKRHDDQEKEILLKAAKSRSKLEDPELLKLKQKAKEMQRAEIEEVRQREANMTALLAIGPRKKFKADPASTLTNQAGNSESSSSSSSGPKPPVRPRVKRVNLRDLLFVMENECQTVRKPLLYKYYAR